MQKISKDKILGVIGLVISICFSIQTSMLPASKVVGDPGPKLFPYIGCFLIGIVSLVLLIKKGKEDKPMLSRAEWKRLYVLFGLYLLFFVLLWLLGYVVAIPVCIFLISMLFSKDLQAKAWKVVVYTVGVSAGIYVAYILLLDTSLPKGIIQNLFK